MKKTPLYKHSPNCAMEHNELQEYFASTNANASCKDAVEDAIASHYSHNCLNTTEAAREVVKQFGYERLLYVLANTIQHMNRDGRVSRDNKEWAYTVPVQPGKDGNRDYTSVITKCNPGLVDLFTKEVRHEYLLTLPLKREDIKAEASKILSQFQNTQEPNSPNGTHYMAQISPDFLARAKTKDHDRLMNMLPFSSLSLSTLEGRKGMYALISKDENRFQPLRLRRSSIRKKLQEIPPPPKTTKKKTVEPER